MRARTLWTSLVLIVGASAARAACDAADAAAETLRDAASSLASLVCEGATASAVDEVASLVDASATISELLVAGCTVDNVASSSKTDTDAASGTFANSVANAFASAETCACEGGAAVLEFASRPAIRSALQMAWAYDDNRKPVMDAFALAVDEVTNYATDHCAPGTVDGVLDQSAEECVALSNGTATPAAFEAGRLGERLLCTSSSKPDPDSAVESASRQIATTLANVTGSALADAHRACSLVVGVRCTLSDEQVERIVIAQIDAFTQRTSDRARTACSCSVDATILSEGLAADLVPAAIAAHSAVCRSVSGKIANVARVLAPQLANSVREVFDAAMCAMPPDSAASTPIPPYGQCGNDVNAKPHEPKLSENCCSTGYSCVIKNEFYAQCLRKSDPVPEGWSGTVLACAA